MTDYETLYKQSLVQLQKQKDQIRKLEDQIRQRCQSYLIHSSRYRSNKKGSTGQRSAEKAQDGTQSQPEYSSQVQMEPNYNYCTIVSNIVDLMLDVHQDRQRDRGVDEATETNEGNQNVGQVPELKKKDTFTSQNSLENVGSVHSKNSASSVHGSEMGERQNVLESENVHPQIYWEEVISGLKERMSSIQKQKSDQAQKILNLEQEIRNYQKEQKSMADLNGSMKKKPIRPIEYASSLNDEEKPAPANPNAQAQLSKLFQHLENHLDFSNCSLEEKVSKVTSHITDLYKRLRAYEEKEPSGEMKESKVQSYNFNTPYRKIKTGDSNVGSQSRDYYEENEIDMLKKKCKELEMELSLSRNKNQSSPYKEAKLGNSIPRENAQNEEEEIINQPPYLIEQELQKPNSPFVKRSFVRKKVVKRNLSAMILRSPSRSKEESKASMMNQLEKLKDHLQRSKDGKNDKEILSLSRKIDKLENKLEPKEQKIDEISEDESSIARSSGIQDNFTEIIQVETHGPGFKNYTAHILGLNRKDKSTHEKKRKENNNV